MTDMNQREAMLRQDGYLLGIATLSLLNGMDFSPWFEPGFVLVKPLLHSFDISSPLLIFYFTSLFLSVASVIIAGIPAALFERATGRTTSDGGSMLVWLGASALVALPTMLKALNLL